MKLVVAEIVKKFLAFHGPRKFIIIFIRSCHTSVQTHGHIPIQLRSVKNKGQKPMSEEEAQEGQMNYTLCQFIRI
jgi:hypothetical protein